MQSNKATPLTTFAKGCQFSQMARCAPIKMAGWSGQMRSNFSFNVGRAANANGRPSTVTPQMAHAADRSMGLHAA